MSVCLGCKTCVIACKDKNDLDVGQNFRRVVEIEGGDYINVGNAVAPNVFAYWISISCNHCDNPKCVANCPTGACAKGENGIVAIDQEKCIGSLLHLVLPVRRPAVQPVEGKDQQVQPLRRPAGKGRGTRLPGGLPG